MECSAMWGEEVAVGGWGVKDCGMRIWAMVDRLRAAPPLERGRLVRPPMGCPRVPCEAPLVLQRSPLANRYSEVKGEG